jgi:hypothetical protein
MVAEGLVTVDDGEMPKERGEDIFTSRKVNTGGDVIDLREMIRQSKGA